MVKGINDLMFIFMGFLDFYGNIVEFRWFKNSSKLSWGFVGDDIVILIVYKVRMRMILRLF